MQQQTTGRRWGARRTAVGLAAAAVLAIAASLGTAFAGTNGQQIGSTKSQEHYWVCATGYSQSGAFINWQCFNASGTAVGGSTVTTGWWWKGTAAGYSPTALYYYTGSNYFLGQNSVDVPTSMVGDVKYCASPQPWSNTGACP